MDEFASTKMILRQNGYTEEVDDKSMSLIAHLLNDIQKLQIKLLSQNANESATESRIDILIKELEETTKQKFQLNSTIESLRMEIATQKEVIEDLKKVGSSPSKLPMPMNEYVEMVHAITLEKESITKENAELVKQHAIDREQLETQSATLQSQRDEILRLTNALSKHQLTRGTLLSSQQKQIEEIQRIYHASQQELQQINLHYQASKEREQSLSIEIAEVKSNCRLLEENLRNEKNSNLDLMERHAHIQSLLELQKGTTADLENSLKQEKNLTRQLQLKIQSFQRQLTELEQTLRELSGEAEAYQKQLKEAEERECETYRQLEEKRKAFDSLLVEQIGNRSSVERLTSENQIQKETVERLQNTQNELDQRIRALQAQETLHLQENNRLKNEVEEKTRLMKEMEQMMNTERTRSLLEVAQLKEALTKKRKPLFAQPPPSPGMDPPENPFPSINETPIKVVESPVKEKVDSSTDLTELISNLSQTLNELG